MLELRQEAEQHELISFPCNFNIFTVTCLDDLFVYLFLFTCILLCGLGKVRHIFLLSRYVEIRAVWGWRKSVLFSSCGF